MNETQKAICQREASDRLREMIATLDPAAVAQTLLLEIIVGIQQGRVSAATYLPAVFGISEQEADTIGALLAF